MGASPTDIKLAILSLPFVDNSAETVLDVEKVELQQTNAWTFTIGFQSLGTCLDLHHRLTVTRYVPGHS